MSFIEDDLRRLDTALDKFQLKEAEQRAATSGGASGGGPKAAEEDPRTARLKAVIRTLSTTSRSNPLLRRSRIRSLLSQIARKEGGQVTATTEDAEISNLEWVAVGKATAQVYGLTLNSLLDRTIPLGESMWYWDDVLGSYANTALYTIQTSPIRFWRQTKEVYADARRKFNGNNIRASAREASGTLSESWREFYRLVRDSVRERSLAQAQTKVLSPFSIARVEVRRNREHMTDLRRASAATIGRLVRECLVFDVGPEDRKHGALVLEEEDWQTTIARSVGLLGGTTRPAEGYDDADAAMPDPTTASSAEVAALLLRILDDQLPRQESEAGVMRARYGKPSRLVRYWIPAVALLLSGSTILRVLVHRKAEVAQWFREAGQTALDFWGNWVLEPARKLIGTIRHDDQSEIAIQSRDSLKADRDSLERMVVDFAVQHPAEGVSAYDDGQVAEIRAKVKAGDLTPVLKAYEKEMQSPIKNALVGDLVRTLLIQVQKTKVDVETAIGGIDSLLKSQELLFGFVGVAPGFLISWALVQWLRGVFGSRSSLRSRKKKGEAIRLVRNIDRTLTSSDPDDDGVISEEQHGVLLCEAHLLRQRATSVLPRTIQREFLEDLDDLLDVKAGVARQVNVLRRIEWAYSRWLQ